MSSSPDSKKLYATLIPGDGIGPEIMEATLRILGALGAPFEWDVCKAGRAGVQECGGPLPSATLDSIRRTGLALKGALETPVGGGYRSSNVRLREEFRLFAKVRPARRSLQAADTRTSIWSYPESAHGRLSGDRARSRKPMRTA